MRSLVLLFTFSCIIPSLHAQRANIIFSQDSLLYSLLHNEDSKLDKVLENPAKYEFQLIYTKVIRKDNNLHFEERYINLDSAFFYAASLIKFPLSIVALEKITELNISCVDLHHRISINTCSCDKATDGYVKNSANPNLLQFLREMMIMSNNDAYNLFFDFVGMDRLNHRMKEMGFDGIVMKNRFTSGCGTIMNKKFGGVRFYSDSGTVCHSIACDSSIINYPSVSGYPVRMGQVYFNGSPNKMGKDYSNGNFVRLADAHHLMMRLFYPELISDSIQQFRMKPELKKELIDAIGSFPRELKQSEEDFSKTPDHYYKFFLDPSVMKTGVGDLRIYNKVGLASGFLSDVSYFEDNTNNIHFFLSSCIYSKRNGVSSQGDADYFNFGIPILRKIGSLIYLYEQAVNPK